MQTQTDKAPVGQRAAQHKGWAPGLRGQPPPGRTEVVPTLIFFFLTLGILRGRIGGRRRRGQQRMKKRKGEIKGKFGFCTEALGWSEEGKNAHRGNTRGSWGSEGSRACAGAKGKAQRGSRKPQEAQIRPQLRGGGV